MTAFSKLFAFLLCFGVLNFSVSKPALADEMTIYFYPSPVGVNWSSPYLLGWSIVGNALRPKMGRMIGHESIEIHCSGKDGLPEYYEFTGQSNTDKNVHNDGVLKQHLGLGVMFNPVAGYHESAAKLIPERKKRYQDGRITFVKFLVSPSSCRRAQAYLAEYRALNLDRIYGGLHSRARYQEGAGCSSFAVSFLEVAGLMNSDFRKGWSTQVRVPEYTIGKPEIGYKVKLFDVLMRPRKYGQWASAQEEGRNLDFWDPDKSHWWVVDTFEKEQIQRSGKYETLLRGNAYGLEVNALDLPTPTGSFWLN